MKKLNVTICLCFVSLIGFSQNKKEQIEELNFRVDSCKTIINSQSTQISKLNLETENLKLSESKTREALKFKENLLKIAEEKNNQLLTENNQLKEKIIALENPPFSLSGNYTSGDMVGFRFNLEIFGNHDSGFSFKYESFCRLGGYEFASSGEGQATVDLGDKFITDGVVLDDASGEEINIEFVKTSTGLDLKIKSLVADGAFCWESGESFSLIKTD